MSDPQPDQPLKPAAAAQPVAAQSVADPKSMTYETAAARVEEIIRRLDSGEASLNETLALVQEGKSLIELCAGELEAVGAALEELRLDELVARLENESTS
jgi:exodeoxyribonuclease VII small subunit